MDAKRSVVGLRWPWLGLALALLGCPRSDGSPIDLPTSDASHDASQADVDGQASNDGGPMESDASRLPDADASLFMPSVFDENHILSTGQSLSVGSQGAPVLSSTQPFGNEMFVTGVLAGGTGLTSFVPLRESNVETMSSGLAGLIGSTHPAHRLLVSAHGVGGIGYIGLKKGTVPYANGIAQVTQGKSVAMGLGRSYVVRAVTNVHGETDHVNMNATYAADLATWQNDYETDVRAITGQTEPIPMLHTQMSSWTKYGQATSAIPAAQLAASTASGGKIVMVGPKYMVAYVADGVHLSNVGYRHMGEYYAKAYRRIVLEGMPWEPLRPISATRTGADIRVVFHVPVPPLAFDTALVPAIVANGFEYTDASGAPPAIASVALDGPDAVIVHLASAPTGASKRVRYAYTGVAGARAGGSTGPRGNLRDSDATPSRHGNALFNWAVHFDMAVP